MKVYNDKSNANRAAKKAAIKAGCPDPKSGEDFTVRAVEGGFTFTLSSAWDVHGAPAVPAPVAEAVQAEAAVVAEAEAKCGVIRTGMLAALRYLCDGEYPAPFDPAAGAVVPAIKERCAEIGIDAGALLNALAESDLLPETAEDIAHKAMTAAKPLPELPAVGDLVQAAADAEHCAKAPKAKAPKAKDAARAKTEAGEILPPPAFASSAQPANVKRAKALHDLALAGDLAAIEGMDIAGKAHSAEVVRRYRDLLATALCARQAAAAE